MIKTLIAIPALDQVSTAFAASLAALNRVGASRCSFLCNSLVYDARNMLAAEALDDQCDRVLWIDSDMQFNPDMMQRMSDDLDTGLDYVCGLFFSRRFPVAPLIYKKVEIATENLIPYGKTEKYLDYPKDSLFQIAGSGFGAVMMTTKMLKDVEEAFGSPFAPMPDVLGEDLAFCSRATQLGYKLYCDSRIKVNHVGRFIYEEQHYRRQE